MIVDPRRDVPPPVAYHTGGSVAVLDRPPSWRPPPGLAGIVAGATASGAVVRVDTVDPGRVRVDVWARSGVTVAVEWAAVTRCDGTVGWLVASCDAGGGRVPLQVAARLVAPTDWERPDPETGGALPAHTTGYPVGAGPGRRVA